MIHNSFIIELIEQYKTTPLLLYTEVLGTLCGITAALTISLMTLDAPFFLVFSFYLLASLLLCFTAWKQKNSRLVLLNGIYSIINVIGLYHGLMLII